MRRLLNSDMNCILYNYFDNYLLLVAHLQICIGNHIQDLFYFFQIYENYFLNLKSSL